MHRFLIALLAFACVICVPALASAQTDVDIATPNGALKATYFSPGKPGPGIVLFHQCDSNRRVWDPLAKDLAAAGFHVLTFNYRNVPDSPNAAVAPTRATPPAPPPPPPPGGAPPHTPAALPVDVPDSEAALTYLLSRNGVDKNRIAAGGASCGVSEAIALARRRTEIRALVLVSGWPRKEGVDFLSKTPRIAVYGVAARQDATAPFDIDAAVTASKHPRSTQKIYGGWQHAAALFATEPDLTPAVVKWLSDVLS